jgi:DNA-binding CsgD family transcriptional regulator/tetratricopeptide (TPR) repeat protein
LPVREQIIVWESRVEALRRIGDTTGARVAALEALHLADSIDDPGLKAHAQVRLAWILFEARDFEGAIGEARRAGELASVAGEAETTVEALDIVYEAFLRAGQYEMVIAAARTARAYADQVGLSQLEAPAASSAESEALFELGRITESAHTIDAALLDPPANRAIRSQLHLLAAQVSIVSGSYDDAAKHLEAARTPEATIEEEAGRGWLATVRAELARAEGRFEDVRAIVDATASRIVGSSLFSGRAEWIWRLVEVGLDAEAARSEAARAAGDGQTTEEVRTVARTLLGYVRDVQRQGDEAGVPGTGLGSHDEALIEGHLARIERRDDPSVWAAAADAFPPRSPRGLGARYRQAEAMLAARASREEIRGVMADAHRAAVEIGARPLAGRFEELARRARIDLRPMSPASPAKDGEAVAVSEVPPPGTAALRGRGLSDREIEVLTLVSAGFSNQEIGARLFITDKTASVHVSHILRKLDAASRTEAATMGVRLGLPEVYRDERLG